MNLSGLLMGMGILGLQFICYISLPLIWRLWRKPARKICLEDVWVMLLLTISLQAIIGTLWSSLRLSIPPGAELILFALTAISVGEICHRFPPPARPIQSKKWMSLLIIISLLARLIPASLQSSLGQSDAYSHLQFGMEIFASGHLAHPIYPVGHSWVHLLPALIFRIDLYTLYRYGGAFYGLTLVLGIFFVSRRAFSERAATCAAMLAAGSPFMLPLIRSGIGVYANQLGLTLIPFLLWALPRRFLLSVPAFIALALSVPMMMLDLLPVLMLYLLIRKKFLQLGLILLVGVCGAGLIYWKLLHLPPEHLKATFYMLSGQEDVLSLPLLLQHFLSVKPVALTPLTRAGVGILSLFSLSLLYRPPYRKPGNLPIILLCAFCGFQSVSGCFQFANYQRAGWLFLIGLAMVSGGIAWRLARIWHLQCIARPLFALSCAGLWFFPPLLQPHLSSAENELVAYLLSIPKDARGHIWSRPFNNLGGGQGDPVRVLLYNHAGLRIRQVQQNEFPRINPHTINWIIIDTEAPHPTRQSFHDREVYKLWERNQLLQLALEQFPPQEMTLYKQGSLKVWKITPGKKVIENPTADPL
jgi:hypothetical protein